MYRFRLYSKAESECVQVCVCLRACLKEGEQDFGPKVPFSQAVAAGQVFGICFLPLFITVILKEACVRDHCPIGPEMLEYFSSPQGSCDSFIYSLSGMHGELSKPIRGVETQTCSKLTFGHTALPRCNDFIRNKTHPA